MYVTTATIRHVSIQIICFWVLQERMLLTELAKGELPRVIVVAHVCIPSG